MGQVTQSCSRLLKQMSTQLLAGSIRQRSFRSSCLILCLVVAGKEDQKEGGMLSSILADCINPSSKWKGCEAHKPALRGLRPNKGYRSCHVDQFGKLHRAAHPPRAAEAEGCRHGSWHSLRIQLLKTTIPLPSTHAECCFSGLHVPARPTILRYRHICSAYKLRMHSH